MSLVLPGWFERPRGLWRDFTRWLAGRMPKGLFARSLLIVILPVVLLQSAVAYIFMERHWQLVTQRLSAAVVADIAAVVDTYEKFPLATFEQVAKIAGERFEMDFKLLPKEPLPATLPKPFFSLLDSSLSQELSRQINKPFWIDTIGNSNLVEIRVALNDATLRVIAARSAAYASNSHIFLGWMVGASLVLLAVAIAFLRNQIRPILRLAKAAQDFGKGREVEFRPHGAREVRQAAFAFVEMKRRIERAMDQRTTMLNGVSHDLRTILTRFKLSLVMLPQGPDVDALQKDVDEMQRMLEAYLAFARGDGGEQASSTDMRTMLEELKVDAERHGHATSVSFSGEPMVMVRPDAFRRLLTNLIANAQRYGENLAIEALREQRFLTIHIDDDGPGIAPDQREDVFRPFFRLDEARNQDHGGTGLGLAIARDIARAHGGDVSLASSPLGGLRATVRVPL
ncbi:MULTISPECIES: ATP-binding protein [unclassified Beijerinckia]|uniref:ATP-binding protein n=1 Tax=unclassified Beijerinckia TaxID=2638183 RepID=UPI00089712FF|nr:MULTISPECIES: ATP-binding protein [unclassified Beijerinckia]MDH7799499.1 two-component system osmolarity sensor histidine kinase EnvZ [Beijerinckia sp. GAS462]SED52566.1 two-component system, OmpR family, osmolarity sensor histidine kinase EnvZ [Beijerinckia sp. 28-YEA-48]